MHSGEPGSPDLSGWVPFGIRWKLGRIDWCHLGRNRFTDPFFDQTIDRCRRESGTADRVTSLEALDHLPAVDPPAAFIFHSSRCGSTLVAQMLAAVPRFTVISEAAVLSSILRPPDAPFPGGGDEHIRLLRQLVNALSLPHLDRGTPRFVKFGSRDVHELPLLRSAFPDVPWFFLYREPLEVLSALAGVRGDALPPGLSESGLLDGDPEAIRRMRPAEFWARVLARFYAAALQAFDPARTHLVNYRELPEALWSSLPAHFGVACTAEEIESMRSASRFSAKSPDRPFIPDSDRKRKLATSELRAAVEEWLRRDYERLESIRLSGIDSELSSGGC